MNQYWTKSLILHGAVVLLLAAGGLKMCSNDDPKIEDQAIVVELMPIGAKTNIKPAPKQEKPAPAKKEEKKEEPKKEEKKPEPKTEPKPNPKPAKEELPTDTAPKKPTVKPVEKELKEPSELDELLKTLDEKKPAPKTDSNQTENTDAKSQSTTDFDPNAPITITEKDYISTMLIKQIEPCWNVPAGAKDAGSLSVTARIMFERDGTMKFMGIDREEYYMSDPFRQVAADNVKRAILDPACNPIKQLPMPEKYDKWRKFKLEFDPSKMIR